MSGRGHARESPFVPDAAFVQLKDLIIRRTGHFYYQDKDDLLWDRLRRRFRGTGARDSAAYIERLSDPVSGEAEWAALEAEITVGETFFFRYAEQFAALRDTILPEIIRRKRETRRIRIWSAGCATGAEPYSVAILLRRLLGEEFERWQVGILGTDINQVFLAAAKRAQYGAWALRAVPTEERGRDFIPAADGRTWTLRPQYRAMVRFERHNLQSLLDGTSPLQFSDFDLILCRNVLIYFHPEAVTAMVRALGERLTEGGWLLVGHAEPNPSFSTFLTPVDLPGAVAYRRGAARDLELPEPAATAAEAAGPLLTPVLIPARMEPSAPAPRAGQPVRAAPPRTPEADAAAAAVPATDALAEVRSLADLGDLARARAACRSGLEADPVNAMLHFYDGLIARALGHVEEAELGFRRAIYLQGEFVVAHYQLGLLLIEAGRREPGRRAIANALRIAAALPGGVELREGDGMTAAAFRAIARLHLERDAR